MHHRQAHDTRGRVCLNSLFAWLQIGKEIPERLYQAFAVVLAYIYRVDKGEDLDRPVVELPEDLRFNEHGNVMSGENDA